MNLNFYLEDDNFKCVYKSGHTNTYCSGSVHLKTNGGVTELSGKPSCIQSIYRCDCSLWKSGRMFERRKPDLVKEFKNLIKYYIYKLSQ